MTPAASTREDPRQASAAAIYTPKDYDLNAILEEIVAIVEGGRRGEAGGVAMR